MNHAPRYCSEKLHCLELLRAGKCYGILRTDAKSSFLAQDCFSVLNKTYHPDGPPDKASLQKQVTLHERGFTVTGQIFSERTVQGSKRELVMTTIAP